MAETLGRTRADGPRTYLGLAIAGFPNLFTITGPQNPPVLSNVPASIEQHVEWITDCVDHVRKAGRTLIEATPGAQDRWVAHVSEVVSATLMPCANSWHMSANIPGKPRAFLPCPGPEGVGGYRKTCDEVAAQGYEGFTCPSRRRGKAGDTGAPASWALNPANAAAGRRAPGARTGSPGPRRIP